MQKTNESINFTIFAICFVTTYFSRQGAVIWAGTTYRKVTINRKPSRLRILYDAS